MIRFDTRNFGILSRFCAVIFIALSVAAIGGCSRGDDVGVDTRTPAAKQLDAEAAYIRQYPDFELNYALRNINAIAAYEDGIFGQGVTIGIADTSVNPDQRDLQEPVLDEDGNPVLRSRVSEGRNFASRGVTDATINPHGTYVALFAAAGRGGVPNADYSFPSGSSMSPVGNMHGVAPMASLTPLQLGHDIDATVFGGAPFEALNWAAEQDIHIVNNSYGYRATVYGSYNNITWSFEAPLFSNYMTNYLERRSDGTRISTRIRALNELLNFPPNRTDSKKDTVFVWAAGNAYWHEGSTLQLFSIGGEVTMSLIVPQDNLYDPDNGFLVNSIASGPTTVAMEPGTRLGENGLDIDKNDAGFYANLPNLSWLDNLEKNWLVVVAVDENNKIADFSNGCGRAEKWCLAAPGDDLRINNNAPGGGRGYESGFTEGTSFAAPIVSGALALLRNNANINNLNMSMTVLAKMLLTTATRITMNLPEDVAATMDEDGVNDIYGYGLLNIDEALKEQNGMNMNMASGANIAVIGTRAQLPSSFAGVRDQLQFAATPVYGPDGKHYHNAQLSDFVGVETSPSAKLGDAASDMLNPVADNRFHAESVFAATDPKTNQFRYAGADINGGEMGTWRFHHQFCDDCETSAWDGWNLLNEFDDVAAVPFFARGEKAVVLQMQGEGLRPFAAAGGNDAPYQQFGLRWRQSSAHVSYLAEVSQINESETFAGANFGALGQTETRTHQGRFVVGGAFSDDWHGYASMEYAHMNADVSGDGFLGAIDGAHATGWAAGIERRNLFTGGDRIRFSARHDGALAGGTARFSYLDPNGDTQQIGARLRDDSATVLGLGYAFSPVQDTLLSFGVESESSRGALSAQLQTTF